jgi:hypothetical protein
MKNENYSSKEKKMYNNLEIKFKKAFSIISYEVFQYLMEEDLKNLKLTNKFLKDIVECNELFSCSIKSLTGFFNKIVIEDDDNKPKDIEKKSKFKEKFQFNKSMNELYKHSTEKPSNRLRSSIKK